MVHREGPGSFDVHLLRPRKSSVKVHLLVRTYEQGKRKGKEKRESKIKVFLVRYNGIF